MTHFQENNVPARAKGRLFIFSAPSGGGKTTLIARVRKAYPDLAYSISHTTRKMRKGEVDGVDYHFIDNAAFEKGIADNRWAEWARVHDHYYGTEEKQLADLLNTGRNVLLDIDVQGARQITKRFADCVTVFIEPPSMEILRQRLENRGSDSPETIQKRLKNAKAEMACKGEYRHVVVNDDLDQAADALISLIASYCR